MWGRLAVAVSGLALITISIGGASAAPLSSAHPAPSRAAMAAPRVTLSPASGPPTTTVSVSGTGFGAYEGVDLYFGTRDLALAGTSRTGRFGPVSITIPVSANPGKYWISAEGRRTRLFTQTPFTVNTNWDQFRFSGKHSGFNPYENVLSPATVPRIDKNWSFATQNEVITSPAVVNGVVYAGSYDGRLYALNASTGAKRWKFNTGGSIYSSPAVANGLVYVGANNTHKVYALNASTGAERWAFTTGGPNSTPAVANGVVYVSSADHKLYALNASTGKKLWSFTTGRAVGSCPAVADGVVYVSADKLYALNASTGTEMWSLSPGGLSSPAVADGVVYAGSAGKVYARNTAGDTLWTFNTGSIFNFVDSSPAVADAVVYIGVDVYHAYNYSGAVYALNAWTGAELWSFTIPYEGFDSSPAVANGVVYIGSEDGRLYALNASTGAELWSFATGAVVLSSPAVANGMVYVGSNNSVYAFGLSGGLTAPPRPRPGSLHPDYDLREQR
jgi:outer membrane protein assembly factor BamB